MKRSKWFVYSTVLLASLVLFGSSTRTFAANDGGGASTERLDRLERRVNEMAERQEQMFRRLEAQMQRQTRVEPARGENRRPQLTRAGEPLPAAKLAKGLHDLLGLLFLIGIICNILLAIWIFADIRKRGEGSGLFIALALVAGIPAAIIYSLIRIGDKKA